MCEGIIIEFAIPFPIKTHTAVQEGRQRDSWIYPQTLYSLGEHPRVPVAMDLWNGSLKGFVRVPTKEILVCHGLTGEVSIY